jgi:hypothetical protein
MEADTRRNVFTYYLNYIVVALGLFRVNRGAVVWCWMTLAVIGGCRPTVRGGVDSRVF